jgi:hypothetical protein
VSPRSTVTRARIRVVLQEDDSRHDFRDARDGSLVRSVLLPEHLARLGSKMMARRHGRRHERGWRRLSCSGASSPVERADAGVPARGRAAALACASCALRARDDRRNRLASWPSWIVWSGSNGSRGLGATGAGRSPVPAATRRHGHRQRRITRTNPRYRPVGWDSTVSAD